MAAHTVPTSAMPATVDRPLAPGDDKQCAEPDEAERRAETVDRSPCLGRSGPAEREPDSAGQDPEGEDPDVGDDASDDNATGRLEQEEQADTDLRPRCSGKEETVRAQDTPECSPIAPKWNPGARKSSAGTRYRRNALSGIGAPDCVSTISYYPRS